MPFLRVPQASEAGAMHLFTEQPACRYLCAGKSIAAQKTGVNYESFHPAAAAAAAAVPEQLLCSPCACKPCRRSILLELVHVQMRTQGLPTYTPYQAQRIVPHERTGIARMSAGNLGRPSAGLGRPSLGLGRSSMRANGPDMASGKWQGPEARHGQR
eukprot:1157995-Pelagomonas_calceolata.AAC.5